MNRQELSDYGELQKRLQRLARGPERRSEIEAHLKYLSEHGIPEKELRPDWIISQKTEVLDRVQAKAEIYEQVSQNCAKSSALAVMEEFGLGNMELIRALSPFPGIALTGDICGAVTGSMAALALYFGQVDLLDYGANARSFGKCRRFLKRFKEALGTTKCREIHERVVFGIFHDVADPDKGFPAFVTDRGFEKCGLPPGIGARIAAEIIIEELEKGKT